MLAENRESSWSFYSYYKGFYRLFILLWRIYQCLFTYTSKPHLLNHLLSWNDISVILIPTSFLKEILHKSHDIFQFICIWYSFLTDWIAFNDDTCPSGHNRFIYIFFHMNEWTLWNSWNVFLLLFILVLLYFRHSLHLLALDQCQSWWQK